MGRFDSLKGIVPEELRIALEREVQHLDPLESNEEVIRQTVVQATTEATGLVNAASINSADSIEQAKTDVLSALYSEVGVLNRRIGTIDGPIVTTDGTATLIKTITPSSLESMRISSKVVAFRSDRLEAASYLVTALARAVPASEVLTVSGVPTAADEIEIDGTTYTFQNTLSAAFDVKIGASAEASIDNLVAAIMLSGTEGVEYGTGTTAHPTVRATKASASTMEAIYRSTGTGGNGTSVTDPVDTGTVLSWGAATMSGGTAMSVLGASVTAEHEDEAAWDVAIAANGADVEIKVTGEAGVTISWWAETETFSARY